MSDNSLDGDPLEGNRRTDPFPEHLSTPAVPDHSVPGFLEPGTTSLADITERLRISEARHEEATTVAKEAIWEVDFRTGTTWWNRAYHEMFDRPPGEHHHGAWWLKQIHPDDRHRVSESFSRAIAQGAEEWAETYRMMKGDGNYASIQDRAMLVKDGAGEVIRAIGAKLDVTEAVRTREELIASKTKLEAALASMNDAVCITDPEGGLVDFNEAFALFHHFSSKEECAAAWSEKPWLLDAELAPGEPAPREKLPVPRALRGETATNVEYTLRRTDTGAQWVGSYSFAPIRNRDDTIAGAVVVCRDITERKRVEEEIRSLNTELEQLVRARTAELERSNALLREANEKWENTFNASSDPIFLLDTDHHITRANRAMAELTGISQGDLIGRPCHQAVHGDDAPPVLCPQCRLICDGLPHAAEVYVDKLDRFLLITVSPIFDPAHNLIGSIHYSKDITEQKRLLMTLKDLNETLEGRVSERTEELKASQGKFSILFNEAAIPAILYRLSDFRFLDVNYAWLQLFGYTKAEMIGKTGLELGVSRDPQRRNRIIQEVQRSGQVRNAEQVLYTKEGVPLTVLTNINVIRIEGEAFALASVHDITDRKRAEQEIIAHQKKLRELAFELQMAEERERTRIAGELHDQVGQQLLLAKMKLEALASQASSCMPVHEVEKVVELLDHSIQDIRALTFRMRPPLLATVGLAAAIRSLCDQMKEDFGLEVMVSEDQEPKPLKYEASSTLYQATRELLLNVAKHAGTKVARLSLVRNGNRIVIAVEDGGAGFDPAVSASSGSRSGGFGLFNLQQKLEYLGGSIAIRSAPGQGTRVVILFPLETK